MQEREKGCKGEKAEKQCWHSLEELATFPQERIEQPTRNSQTRREKVGEPMARKATEVKKAKNMHCFLSMGKYDFEWALFGENLRRGVLANEHVLCLQKTSRKFLFRNICFDTSWWERGGVSFDSAKPGNRESGWGAVVMSIYVLCIVYVFVLCIVYYVYCICPYMKCDAHDVTLL